MFPTLSSSIGTVCAISFTTPDFESSLNFYQQLGFTELFRADFPFAWVLISDGSIQIMLRLDQNPYSSLTYFIADPDTIVADLEAKGITFTIKAKSTDMVKRFVMQSPDGLNIAIVTNVNEVFRQPEGTTLLTMKPEDFGKPEKYPNPFCGVFGEFAHPVKNLDDSLLFWQSIGFSVLSKNTMPYPWSIVSDGTSIIGLHQTENFNYPAITYFGTGVKQKVELLKSKGIANIAERSGPANVVLTTPEMQHIFLLSLM